jgi:hypothetical protein
MFRKHELFQGVFQIGLRLWHTGWAFLRVLRAELRLESVPSRYCGTGEARESEDHAWILVGGVGNGVWTGKGTQWRSYADLLARQALFDGKITADLGSGRGKEKGSAVHEKLPKHY